MTEKFNGYFLQRTNFHASVKRCSEGWLAKNEAACFLARPEVYVCVCVCVCMYVCMYVSFRFFCFSV
jgi:hypothetical protein